MFAGKSITNFNRLHIVWAKNGEKWRMVIMSFFFTIYYCCCCNQFEQESEIRYFKKEKE